LELKTVNWGKEALFAALLFIPFAPFPSTNAQEEIGIVVEVVLVLEVVVVEVVLVVVVVSLELDPQLKLHTININQQKTIKPSPM
jgi:hypothetical protein